MSVVAPVVAVCFDDALRRKGRPLARIGYYYTGIMIE